MDKRSDPSSKDMSTAHPRLRCAAMSWDVDDEIPPGSASRDGVHTSRGGTTNPCSIASMPAWCA